MIPTILGTKLNMTQIYDSQGQAHPATLIQAGPCWITQIKQDKKNGYSSIQIGFGTKKRLVKPLSKHLKKAGIDQPLRFLREVKLDQTQLDQESDQLKPGTQISLADVLQAGDLVAITGTAKGKGFTGVIKRHGFHGGPRTHGQSDRQRAPGSIGAGTTPGRVHKGKKMAGRSGGHQVTIKGLLVLSTDPQTHQVIVKGAVPGHRRSLLTLTKTGHDDSFPGLATDQPAEQEKQPQKETPKPKDKLEAKDDQELKETKPDKHPEPAPTKEDQPPKTKSKGKPQEDGTSKK
jgi:large subunit ribosomal protein L3